MSNKRFVAPCKRGVRREAVDCDAWQDARLTAYRASLSEPIAETDLCEHAVCSCSIGYAA